MNEINRSSYIDQISPFLNKPLIKILTGMRRVGKSSIVKLLITHLREQGIPEKAILYINKESLGDI